MKNEENKKETIKKKTSTASTNKKTTKKSETTTNGKRTQKTKTPSGSSKKVTKETPTAITVKRKTTKKPEPKKKNEEQKVIEKEIKIENTEVSKPLEEHKKEISKETKYDLSFSLFEVILIIIITILSCLLVFNFVKLNEPKDNNKEIAENELLKEEIEDFLEQYEYILNNYYGDIDGEQLIKAAISGMLNSLDAYSGIIDEESNSFSVTLEGEYEGVGISIYNDVNGNIIIDSVYENTPAYKAGLKQYDIITKFNDIDLKNVSTSDLVNKIATNGEFTLTILREGSELEVRLKREKVILNSVKSEMLDNKVGYIDIDIFANNTPEQFEKALKGLEKQNMKSLIIDLRDNTGGHLSSVEEMLYLFLDKKNVIYQMEDQNGAEKFYSKGTKTKTYDIVILQNGNSASASEIMASALKENLNAYIIGNKSFGKGTVQTLITMDENTQYKVTTKIWKTPKGNWVNGTGIIPDLEVNLQEQYYLEPIRENDNQLKAAIDYLK